jgi:hypothetical protein
MIVFTLDLGRIDKSKIFTSAKTGKRYLSFGLVEGPDQYSNAGQVVHSISREARAAGVKAGVVGSWKILGGRKPKQRTTTEQGAP